MERSNFIVGIAQLFVALLLYFHVEPAGIGSAIHMTRDSWIILFICGGFAFSGFGLYRTFRPRVTTRNVRKKVGNWLHNLGYSYSVVTLPGWHWGINVTSVFPNVLVARSKKYGDLLIFLTAIEPMSSEQRRVFEPMSDSDKQKFHGELAIEAAKSKIAFFSDPSLNEIRIEKGIPITPQLAVPNVIESINEIRFSAIVIWNTIANRLGGKAFELAPPQAAAPPASALPAKQPSLTPNTEASQQ